MSRRGSLVLAAGCCSCLLLAGDGDIVADIFRNRVLVRGKGSEVWGWGTAYGKPSQSNGLQPKAEGVKS